MQDSISINHSGHISSASEIGLGAVTSRRSSKWSCCSSTSRMPYDCFPREVFWAHLGTPRQLERLYLLERLGIHLKKPRLSDNRLTSPICPISKKKTIACWDFYSSLNLCDRNALPIYIALKTPVEFIWQRRGGNRLQLYEISIAFSGQFSICTAMPFIMQVTEKLTLWTDKSARCLKRHSKYCCRQNYRCKYLQTRP